jgi:hypothetical protein
MSTWYESCYASNTPIWLISRFATWTQASTTPCGGWVTACLSGCPGAVLPSLLPRTSSAGSRN